MTTLEPKIYVACLAAYNSGILHGAWIDATQGIDTIRESVNAVLSSSPIPHAEEWAIHDFEDFGGIQISEYESIETVSSLAQFILTHGELGEALLKYFGNDMEHAKKMIEECYHGSYESEVDYVQSFLEDTGREIPDYLAGYIDFEAMARDWFICDFHSFNVGREVHVFSQR